MLFSGTFCTAQPIVPGYERWTQVPERFSLEEQGELLLGELNCVGCHTATAELRERLDSKPPPDLSTVGARLRPEYFRRFLAFPHPVKPGLTMPDLFHAASLDVRHRQVEALTHFLALKGGPLPVWDGSEALASELEAGKRTFETLGCVACHAPEATLESATPSVPLGDLAQKTTVNRLQDFLLHPHRLRPRSRMPRFRLGLSQAHAVAAYLLRGQFPSDDSFESTPGLLYEYYLLETAEAEPLLDDREPKNVGRQEGAPFRLRRFGFRDENVAYRFRGQLRIAEAGNYSFGVNTAGGAVLRLDGEEFARSDGTTEAADNAELEAGLHGFELVYWNAAKSPRLHVSWSGPDFKRQPIPNHVFFNRLHRPMVATDAEPFEPDAEQAKEGERVFAERGCAHCHRLEATSAAKGLAVSELTAPQLTALDPTAKGGCLDENVADGRPNYNLTRTQRSALTAALRALPTSPPRSALTAVHFTMASRNCLACHERDGVGGPDDGRRAYFNSREPLDIGFEGHIPPRLTGVGAKLRHDALRTIIAGADMSATNNLHVRPYFATVMPSFPLDTLPDLPTLLTDADRLPDVDPFTESAATTVKTGEKLVGATSLSCVSCHPIGPVKSQGAPGIDLVFAHRRLRAAWFARFLAAPAPLKPDTRMPSYWTDGNSPLPDVLGGSPWQQMEAIWYYLGLGPSMAPPAGTRSDAAAFELTPSDEVIVLRGLMEGVGPRTVLSGFPAGVHFAFDANHVRLAKIWRGAFFNASGVWVGRRTRFLAPSSDDVYDLPAGPSIARLAQSDVPWPSGVPGDRDLAGDFLGYSLAPSGGPRWTYAVAGVRITEEATPWLVDGGAFAKRRFKLAGTTDEPLYLLLTRGTEITSKSPNSWTTAAGVEVEWDGSFDATPQVRETPAGKELLLPLPTPQDGRIVEVRLRW